MPLEARAESAPRDEDHARGAARAGRGPIASMAWILAKSAPVLVSSFDCQPCCCSGPGKRQTKILGDIETIQKVALGIFRETDHWPESIEAMGDARDSSGKGLLKAFDRIPKDPWHHEHPYGVLNNRIHLRCWGSGDKSQAADVAFPRGRS